MRRRRRRKLGEHQSSLLTGRTRAQENKLKELQATLDQLYETLQVARRIVEKNYDVDMISMDLERYHDQRVPGAYWFLTFEVDESLGAPDINDYEFGSYWTGHNKDSERFVIDRAKWGIKYTYTLIKETAKEYAKAKGVYYSTSGLKTT